MSGKRIFEITDPQGRRVIFHDDTWEHIKSGHPEITNYRRIKTTVMDPQIIIRPPLRNSLIYVDCTQLHLYFNVATKVDDTLNECTVSSAYLTRYLLNGDIIWLRDKEKRKKAKKAKK
jgi:hypothetical protein